jgi:NitT/TauT family transport system permease protein
VTLLRIAIILTVLVVWEGLAVSGLLYRDVVPRVPVIALALWKLLTYPDEMIHLGVSWRSLVVDINIPQFYVHLWVTGKEIVVGLAIGGVCGLLAGLVLGANRLLGRAYEAYLYYLGPTPKIIFLPVMIMWFGVGPGSKIAMAALSCFFPIALSTASGMRQIDKVLIRVGKSFRLNAWQMSTKIYLPAMRAPLINGVRLGLGVALIGALLAETRLSSQGVGFLIINAYSVFDMPRMYAILIVLFIFAIGANALISKLGRLSRS